MNPNNTKPECNCEEGCEHRHSAIYNNSEPEAPFEPYEKPGTIIKMSDGTTYRVSERGPWVKVIE